MNDEHLGVVRTICRLQLSKLVPIIHLYGNLT